MKSTAEKILETATKLFSTNGVDGASIRMIAEKADVNIAAIHYYFQSKENLILQVFLATYKKIEKIFESIDVNLPIEKYSFELYKKLLKNHTDVLNTFQMLLSSKVHLDHDVEDSSLPLLPPGGKILFKVISARLDKKISESKRYWMTYVIFQRVLFMALFEKVSSLKENVKNYRKLINMQAEEEISLFVKLILNKK